MGVGNVIKIMKEIHPESIILIKIGTFYHGYAKDAYILSYLFGYQMKKVEINLDDCGFPKAALNKVLTELESKKINYLLINKSLNYEVEDEMNFKSKNGYKEFYAKSHRYVAKKNKIDAIHQYLLDNINDENIMKAFDEVCRNTRNRRKVNKFRDFRCMYISIIYHILAEKTYRVGPYKDTDNFIFLGRSLDGKYARYREIYRRLKKRKYLYSMGSISLMSYASSIASYQYLNGGRLNMKRIRTRLMNSRAGAINICRILSHDFSCILKKCVYNINYS